MSATRKLRLLSFGDSLTEGWHKNGFKFHPYTIRLGELFKQIKREVEIVNRGISGEVVYPEMITRLPAILEKDEKYDFAIILAGTNDMADLDNAQKFDLFKNVKRLHEIAHEKNIKTCAITIPQCSYDMLPQSGRYVKYREEVNENLREFASVNSKLVCLCDLSRKLPMFGISDSDLMKYWDDDLHFTPQGYDKMAELIFEVIKNFIDLK